MRISDWSSDVCSSDLVGHREDDRRRRHLLDHLGLECAGGGQAEEDVGALQRLGQVACLGRHGVRRFPLVHALGAALIDGALARSEEHTSELQSLMRISYAVFCLKKKKKHNT